MSSSGRHGLDNSYRGSDAAHVLKGSFDDDFSDVYAIGVFDPVFDVWKPSNTAMDVQTGLRYDYGKFYASKSFFDPSTRRRILWGWINESDSRADDVAKNWASVMAVPRVVSLDPASKQHLLQDPVAELKSLRGKHFSLLNQNLAAGERLPLIRGRQVCHMLSLHHLLKLIQVCGNL